MLDQESGRVRFPDFELPDEQGQPWRLWTALSVGSAVLVFYRRDW